MTRTPRSGAGGSPTVVAHGSAGETPTDESLVAAARAGDPAALEQLLRRHHDRVLGVCLRLCRDRGDAEDSAQEALVAIVRGLDRFDGRSRFSTWAYRVTTNCCLDELRRRRRRPDPVDADRLPETPSTEPGPDDVVEGRATRAHLAAALDDLPDEFRTPLVLRDVADLDYATIGEILDLAPGTVRSRISRARARLADRLAPDPASPPPSRATPATDTASGTVPGPRSSQRPSPMHDTDTHTHTHTTDTFGADL